jgi:glycosyltransferase involved in cell wall biosynthesis
MEQTLVIICGIVALFGVVMTLLCVLAQRRIQWLTPDATPIQTAETLSVVIPARNEEADLAAALGSVLAQEGVELEVTVVNDHSTDRTGEIADAIARVDPRVRVIHDPSLPPEWLGKCNAMQQGAAVATGDYLLFADADVVHAPTCFATVLRTMRENACDFFSVMPRFENQSFWEHVNIPLYCFGIARLLAIPGLEDPDSPNAVAAGALMLVKARVFREVGGFREVKGEMLDDIGFARLLKTRHYRIGFRLAPECLRVRLFKTNREAFWGNTKNILVAVEGYRWLAVPLIVLGFAQLWAPLLALALGVVNMDGGLLLVGLATYGIQYLSFFTVRRLLRFRSGPLLFFPLAAIVAACCILRALYYSMRGAIFWRGREIKVRG